MMHICIYKHQNVFWFSWPILSTATSIIETSLIIAHYYALAQDLENTLLWLERAVDSHASSLVYVVSNPMYSFVRDEERYLSVLSKMNLPYDPYRDIQTND